jgi:coenzyme F420-reducing hydrogenase alpha subunit
MTEILIDPITRISGNAGLNVLLDEENQLEGVRFQAFGYRGFEQIARGAHIDNLLPIVSRICGGDSLFHQIAAVTAVEKALSIIPSDGARRLRELAMWGQLFERHAVSLTVHSLPDLLFPSSDPALRNIISIHRVDEEIIRRVMKLKSLGTSILREAGGRAVHPVNFLPGGVVKDIEENTRKELIDKLNEAKPLLIETGHLLKLLMRRNEESVNTLGITPFSSLALKGVDGMVINDAGLAAVSADGTSLGLFDPDDAARKLNENNSLHSHIRNAELSGVGAARVGPLARLNVNQHYGTPLADEELEEVKSQWGFPLHQSMTSHIARIMEMIHAWERMVELLSEPAGGIVRQEIVIAGGRGVSAVEAPEGLLIYNLTLDNEGLVSELNLTAPLQFNIGVLERNLEESARNILGGIEPDERLANLLEMAVRAYAPCVPCGIH